MRLAEGQVRSLLAGYAQDHGRSDERRSSQGGPGHGRDASDEEDRLEDAEGGLRKMKPKIVSREAWLKVRKKFLAKEKAFTRQRDRLSAERRKLPWVRVEKEYVFDARDGKVGLADLFRGKSQLIIYHFMFDPKWDEGCPSCSFL